MCLAGRSERKNFVDRTSFVLIKLEISFILMSTVVEEYTTIIE